MVKSMNIVNEATAIGKKIFSDAKGKLFFGYQNDDDTIQFVDYKTWKKLPMKDLSNEFLSNRVINSIVRNQKQFNKKVEYNMWSKKTNPSFEDRMDYFIKNGWISNITKAGIKESIESVNEAYVPSNIKDFAKRKGVTQLVNTVAGWAEKVGKKISGGTAVGRNYDTLVLDMTYNGSEIRINCETERVELYDELVRNFQQFRKVYDEYQMDESINEASLSDIDIIAQEANDFKDFVKEFYKEYKDFAKTKEALKWLEDIYKNRSKMEGLERVASGLPQTEEEPISENSLSDLEKKLKSHDWWFAYSDDGSKYRRGSDNWNELTSMLKSLKGPQAEKLFNKYVPDGFSPTYKKLVESNSTPMNEDFRMGFRNIIHLIPTGYAPNDPKYKSELRYLINTLNNFYKERGYDRKILSIY